MILSGRILGPIDQAELGFKSLEGKKWYIMMKSHQNPVMLSVKNHRGPSQ